MLCSALPVLWMKCPVRALGCNAPLIWFLLSVLYILFACLYHMLPHFSFFSSLFFAYLLPYLSFPLLEHMAMNWRHKNARAQTDPPGVSTEVGWSLISMIAL